jgi:2-iminobutanoate/2-iminopropanoate deaminase
MTHPIATTSAPAALGAYCQAIDTGALVFCSGQLGLDPASGELVSADVAQQADQALANLGAVLAAAGLSLADVVKTTIYLADMADFAAVNQVYAARLDSAAPPARSTVAVAGLPKAARVEIEAIAARPGGPPDKRYRLS